jgi:uncharacterized phiE125 gp8 family phage protein
MGLKLVTPPAADILSLQEAKSWLKLETADDDALVTALVTAARLAVEGACARKLVAQQWIWTLDAWPPGRVIRLPLSPLLSVIALRVSTSATQTVTLPLSSLTVDNTSDPPRIVLSDVPAPGLAASSIAVEAVFGYAASPPGVPEPLRHAARLMLAALYENRGENPGMVTLPPAAAALIEPYRARRLS